MTIETVNSRRRRQKPQKNTPSGQQQGSQTCTRCGKSPPHTRVQCKKLFSTGAVRRGISNGVVSALSERSLRTKKKNQDS